MSFLQIPYREARDGYWGEQTSTLNWCEEDYNISYYCAEVVNSLTNLTFILLGLGGIQNTLRYGHPRIFIVAFTGYMIVGFGSIAFHSTLKSDPWASERPLGGADSMQLADELPMIYATCVIGYATFSYAKPRLYAGAVGLALFSLALLITVVYWVTKDPVFHQVSYATLTCAIVFRAMYIMEYELRPALEKRSPDKAEQIMKQMWRMCFSGIALFLIGFTIWNLDNIYCVHLRSWRDVLLLPWAVVLEGHGWWHLFTGLAYYFIAWRVWLHRCLDGSENEFMLQWPSPFTSIPRVVPRVQEANGNGNGVKHE